MRPLADLSDSERQEICALYEQGEILASIGEAYGLSAGSVSGLAKQAGIKPRQLRTVRALEGATLDVSKLAPEEVDGEPRVRDVTLGEALGYKKPRDIRPLIKRLQGKLLEVGKVPQCAAASHSGRGAQSVTETWLNLPQINYLITRCGLPRADEYCVHIARVFTAWQEQRLAPADYETAVEMQDSAEQAAQAAPEIAAMTAQMIEEIIARRTSHLATKDHLIKIEMMVGALRKRKDCTEETKRQHILTLKLHYNGMCPCCKEKKVISEAGEFTGHFDHWTDNNARNGAHETWPTCPDCNGGFEVRRLDRADYRARFDVYQMDRRIVVEGNQRNLI